MGNCLALCDSDLAKQGRYVRVAKSEGDMFEFSTPIAVSKQASESLSADHKLKAPSLYYLLPDLGNRDDAGSGIKRLKLVITKQQLQQLVAKQISLEDVLSDLQSRTLDLPTTWMPQLDSIPEGNE